MRVIAVAWAVALLGLIGFAVQALPIEAHALLVRSDPPEGARLAEPPTQVTAWFSERLEPGVSSLRVFDGAGGLADQGQVQVDPSDSTKMSVSLGDDLASGLYLVTWETLSRVDGHFRFGSFEFVILNPDGSEPSGTRPSSAPSGAGSPGGEAEGALTKIAGLVGAVVLLGSLAFVLLVTGPASKQLPPEWRKRVQEASDTHLGWLALPSIALLAVVGGAELVLQARQIGGLDNIGTVLDTSWGERWLQRQVVLGGLVAAFTLHLQLRRREELTPTVALWLALSAALGYLLLVSTVSHAGAVLAGSFWAVAADFVHLLAAAIWIGSIAQLALLLIRSRRILPDRARWPFLADSLRRFSLLAAISVVTLLATGTFSAFVEVPAPEALIETAYGRVLTAKLALLLPLLLVAGINALILRPRLVRQAAQTAPGLEQLRRLLARTVALEAALAVGVLAIVGVLVQYTPSRAEAEAAAGVQAVGGRFDLPFAAGSWANVAAVAGVVGGLLAWLWAAHTAPSGGPRLVPLRWLGAGTSAFSLLVVLLLLLVPQGREGFTADVAFRYQTPSGAFVLLEISPFEVGENTFRVKVLSEQEQPIEANAVELRFSRLEKEGVLGEVAASPANDKLSYLAQYEITETGWWAVDVQLDRTDAVSFYLRLDDRSQAPLAVSPPDYQSDPDAGALFRKALELYENLSALKWREELTSGLAAPTGIGAWIITTAEAEAPDRVHLHTLSPGSSDYDLYRVGSNGCVRQKGSSWECSVSEATDVFDLEYQEPATAFRSGRRELVDGEMTQVVLFYNPSQPAWYAWWIGEGTGYLRRQAMVAPGHFMLLRFFDHDVPIGIAIPSEALATGP